MKRIIVKLLNIRKRITAALLSNAGGRPAFIMIIGALATVSVLVFLKDESLGFNVFLVALFIFLLMTLFLGLEMPQRLIWIISRHKHEQPKNLLKDFTNISFLYGILWFSIYSFITIYFFTILNDLLFGLNSSVRDVMASSGTYIFIMLLYLFILLYFSYHITCSEADTALIRSRLTHYLIINACVGILFIFIQKNLSLEIFTGLLVYPILFLASKHFRNSKNTACVQG